MKKENKEKTMSEVWKHTLDQALILKVQTKAKNLPEVWEKAISLLEEQIHISEEESPSELLKNDFRAIADRRTNLNHQKLNSQRSVSTS